MKKIKNNSASNAGSFVGIATIKVVGYREPQPRGKRAKVEKEPDYKSMLKDYVWEKGLNDIEHARRHCIARVLRSFLSSRATWFFISLNPPTVLIDLYCGYDGVTPKQCSKIKDVFNRWEEYANASDYR